MTRSPSRHALLAASLCLGVTEAVLGGCASEHRPSIDRTEAALTPIGPYPDLVVTRPNPEPAFPAVGFDTFAPPVDTSVPPSTRPTLTALSPPVGTPDDTVVLVGEQLTTGTNEGKDSSFNVYGQTTASDATEVTGLLQRLNGREAAVTLPSTLPGNSMYLVWPRNSTGYGRPMAINKAEAWWLGQNTRIARGDTAIVYGRNLASNRVPNTSHVYLKAATGTGTWAVVTSVNPYRVAFTVPDLANGQYEVWVHNSHGGHYGWAGPLALTVSDPFVFTGPEYNVRQPPYNAVGDGIADDTNALLNALIAAVVYMQNNPNTTAFPTVYLPAGRYAISQGFGVYSNIRWRGDGKDVSSIECHPQFKTPDQGNSGKFGIFVTNGGTYQNFEVRDLTLDDKNNMTPEGDGTLANKGMLLFLGNVTERASNLRLINVRVKTVTPGVVAGRIFSTTGVTIQDSEIYNNVFFWWGQQVNIRNTTFIGNNDLNQFVTSWVTSHVALTGSTFKNLSTAATGSAVGRVLAGSSFYGSNRNIYFGDNTTIDLAPRPDIPTKGVPDQNSGEQLMYEDQRTLFRGNPGADGTPNTFTLPGVTPDLVFDSLAAVIVDGPGMGQYRPITAFDPNTKTITVWPSWTVPPTTASTVLVAATADHLVAYHNTFDGKSTFDSQYSGSTAIQPYGGCYDWVADSNTMTDLRMPFFVAAVRQPAPFLATQPVWHSYFANNTTQRCNNAVLASVVDPAESPTALEGAALLGNVWRNNTFTSISDKPLPLASDPLTVADGGIGAIRIFGVASSSSGHPMRMNVWEHNRLTNLSHGVNVDPPGMGGARTTDLVFYKNDFTLGTAPPAGSYGIKLGWNANPALRENTWPGFITRYAGNVPGPILEVPRREVVLNALPSGSVVGTSFPVWNSGTGAMSVTITDDASWLTVTPTNPSGIAVESGATNINVTADPAGKTAATYEATISVNDGTRTQRLTAKMVVSSTGGLPSPWATADLGSVNPRGGAGHGSGTFTLEGSGAIAGSADALRYVHQSCNASCELSARVGSLSGGNSSAKAGVLIRESTASGAKAFGVWVTAAGVVSTSRSSTNGSTTTSSTASGSLPAPYWVRVARTINGNGTSTFRAYHSSTGSAWTQFTSVTMSMNSTARMGLAVASGNTSLATATLNRAAVMP